MEDFVMKDIRRTYFPLFIAFVFICGVTTAAYGDDYPGAKVTVVKKAATTADGRKMEYPKTGNPEVTALLVELPPGGETGWHLHPVPVYAYILSGTLTAEMENGEKHDYEEGEAIFEAVNMPHNGRNPGKTPVRLIVFYTGEEGKPVTVKVTTKGVIGDIP
jgi:quercetin dioxygenase-like cupin family protein